MKPEATAGASTGGAQTEAAVVSSSPTTAIGPSVLLVDPSLFTGPYDAALNDGLVKAGVRPRWATRPTRPGDRDEIPRDYVDDYFYRGVDTAQFLPGPLRALAKGLSHMVGLLRLMTSVHRQRPDVVHLQWLALPPLDVMALAWIRRRAAIVLTMHDTVPFNGSHKTLLQRIGIWRGVALADAVIVHTQSGRERLARLGVPEHKLEVIAHGPLALRVPPPAPRAHRDTRACFVAFGEIKPYKGLDLLIEALAALPEAQRAQCRAIVAGRPQMDLEPLRQRIAALGLEHTIELRPRRQTEEEMAVLFDDADAFVFPYRQIDASGVYFLV